MNGWWIISGPPAHLHRQAWGDRHSWVVQRPGQGHFTRMTCYVWCLPLSRLTLVLLWCCCCCCCAATTGQEASEKAKAAFATRQAALAAADEAPALSETAVAAAQRDVAALLLPNETVTAGLRRLGAARKGAATGKGKPDLSGWPSSLKQPLWGIMPRD